MSKNNMPNPKKGKAPQNPASVDLFVDSEATTRPNSVENEDLDDSVTDAAYIPLPDTSSSESQSEVDDPEVSPLVKAVKKSVKAGLKDVPDLHPLDKKPHEAAVWNYFHKRIQRDENDVLIEKQAVCQIKLPVGRGVICGSSLKQPGCSTTGPRNHIKRKHPKEWAELLAIESAKAQVKRGASRILHQTFDTLEGEKIEIYIRFKTINQ